MTDFEALLRLLARARVEFIIVGGAAATVHGSSRLTQDLDIVYRRSTENLHQLAEALSPYHPYLRGAPVGLPFRLDAETLQRGLNFTLVTDLGDLDLLGEIAGGGNFEALLGHAQPVEVYGAQCYVLGLERLIEVKRAAGRPKDFEAIAELEKILEARESG
ncbi:MAG TPA: nucleotidyltransferase [Vicinamibacteria bacterium]|nr:nucleotidyltransferase [Vicinamibacteria bacterium]